MGRPSKRTPEVEAKVVDALRAGNYLETAAAYAGIHRDTLNQWRKQFPDFSDAVTRARAEAEGRNVALIQKAAPEDWRAAAWWLERSFPKRWGRRVELDGEVNLGLADVFERIWREANGGEEPPA